jgi:hypothetical protein
MFSVLLNFISSYKSKSLLVIGCHIVIRSWWCNIVLNVHVPREEDDDSNDSFMRKYSRLLNSFLSTI